MPTPVELHEKMLIRTIELNEWRFQTAIKRQTSINTKRIKTSNRKTLKTLVQLSYHFSTTGSLRPRNVRMRLELHAVL